METEDNFLNTVFLPKCPGKIEVPTEKEREALEARIAAGRARLKDDTFLAKAPSAIIEKEKGKLSDSEERLAKLEERLAQLD